MGRGGRGGRETRQTRGLRGLSRICLYGVSEQNVEVDSLWMGDGWTLVTTTRSPAVLKMREYNVYPILSYSCFVHHSSSHRDTEMR